MNFVVPQFLDVEDKIFGPISVRQFLILVAGIGITIGAYQLADLSLFIIEAVFIASLTLAFAFLRVNARPFHYFILTFIQTLKRPNLRIWKQEVTREKRRTAVTAKPKARIMKKQAPTASRLQELSLIVDTGGAYREEDFQDSQSEK